MTKTSKEIIMSLHDQRDDDQETLFCLMGVPGMDRDDAARLSNEIAALDPVDIVERIASHDD